MLYFSKSTSSFYHAAIHGPRALAIIDPVFNWPQIEVETEAGPALINDPDIVPPTVKIDNPETKIPVDAVEITLEEHADLLEGQSAGKRIVGDANGRPVLQDPPAPTLADLKANKNADINTERGKANSTSFEHDGKAFACDALSRGDIDGVNGFVAITGALPPGFPCAWKAIDNSYLTIPDVAAWTAFYGSMIAAGALNFAHAQELKATLAAAQTPEAIAAITW